MRKMLFAGAAVALMTLGGGLASAAQLTVTSYDTPNGDGQAAGGTYNYWDATYSGAGAKTTDNAPLTGGTGVLTDGHVELQPWYDVSNNAGTGTYVGWQWRQDGDPTITFHFAGAPTVNSVAVAVDASDVGGVFAPLTLTIDGTQYTPTVTSLSTTSELLTVAGLSLTGGSVTLTPNHDPNAGSAWDFLSEVTFNGAAGVPEPSTWAMMLVGFGLIGGALRGLALADRKLAWLRSEDAV